MPYSKNPHLPKVRALAVRLVREHSWSVCQVARHLGFHRATISEWLARAPVHETVTRIPTRSSRPLTSPRAIDRGVVERIVALRRERGRCAAVIHAQLAREGIAVSFSTVHRTLVRHGLVARRSPWKRLHRSGERPTVQNPGDLVEMDSIHLWGGSAVSSYLITLLDCCSRWAYASAVLRLTSPAAVAVAARARRAAPFPFSTIQSDHGSEFSTHFTRRLAVWGIGHRHIRVRTPNDNAHVERFNRTIQDELREEITRWHDDVPRLNRAVSAYLTYYNQQRLHMGLQYQTPTEVLGRS